ncbi:MAG TPA: exodeoxyribonuclease VII large subunit [Methanoregulaceae archaeon]|nr:exodeoxyribonuclease VII large subunit [Methanoregulaceae archaeon]
MVSGQGTLDRWQEQSDRVLRVSELSSIIKEIFLDERLQDIFVEGEITNYKHHSRGHRYFSLSERAFDEASVIHCVMWQSQGQKLSFTPEDGMHVIVRGYVDVYQAAGKYQLYVHEMRLAGAGEKYLLVEQWKKELAAEGCFLEERKRELPKFPCTVGVVTSKTGAVLQDIRNVINRRYPVRIILSPTAVQGETAHLEIAEAIRRLDGHVDIIIVARGGGSFEDLFPFNHPEVVRAIATSSTPVVSAVGHEVDTTLADYAADARAPTPSAAAELVVPDRAVLTATLRDYTRTMETILVNRHDRACRELETLRERLHPRRLIRRVADRRQYIEDQRERLLVSVNNKISSGRLTLAEIRSGLSGKNPLAVLARGYCVAEKQGSVVRSARSLGKGDRIVLRLVDGRGEAVMENVRYDEKI